MKEHWQIIATQNTGVLKIWLRNTIFYVVGGSLALSIMCRVQVCPLSIPIGLFFGWVAVTKTYLLIDSRMTVFGDIMLFFTTASMSFLSIKLFMLWCLMLPDLASCNNSAQTACTFITIFTPTIGMVSLWLWWRIRGKLIFK